MPATHIPLGGGVSVDALLDAVADHPKRLEDAFHGTPAGGWEAVVSQHPATVGEEGRWRLSIYAYLVRTPQRTLLIDAGLGPAGAVAAEWLGAESALVERLEALGVAPASVDVIVFTHLHEDHVGWGAHPRRGTLTFERARYVVTADEWASERERGIRRHVEEGVLPAQQRGCLEPVDAGVLVPGIDIVALAGHTRGHAGVLVHGSERQVLLAGDAFNHPVQVGQPEIASGADVDPAQAANTRRRLLDRVDAEGLVVGSAHLPGGWWRARREGDERCWENVG